MRGRRGTFVDWLADDVEVVLKITKWLVHERGVTELFEKILFTWKVFQKFCVHVHC